MVWLLALSGKEFRPENGGEQAARSDGLPPAAL
jgi:hypothetical protein